MAKERIKSETIKSMKDGCLLHIQIGETCQILVWRVELRGKVKKEFPNYFASEDSWKVKFNSKSEGEEFII